MTMPEATVDKDHGVPAREDDIGMAGQVGSVKREPESCPMQEGSDPALGGCVLAANPGHHPASGCPVNDVGHGQAAPRARFRSLTAAGRAATTFTSARATASTTGTATAFPNCL
jgi:hypothetical protein